VIGLLLAAAIAATPVSFLSKNGTTSLTGSFYSAGPAKLPAVVVLHTCAGIDDAMTDWAQWLAQSGYDALVVDSFGPRHVESVCGTHNVPPRERALDAYGALAYLRSRADVDGDRIGVIGFSHGGGTVLWTENADLAAKAGFASNGFRAAIAFYPNACDAKPAAALTFPLLVLIGALDNWTDAATCQQLLSRVDPGQTVGTIHVYPGAYHKFDDPQADRIAHIGAHQYTLRYDAAAAADAHDRVLAFLRSRLGP
jgi:dienelactone hydrolase